jgi:hypothetical protein
MTRQCAPDTGNEKIDKLRKQRRDWERNNRVKFSQPKSRTPPAEPFKVNKGVFTISFN